MQNIIKTIPNKLSQGKIFDKVQAMSYMYSLNDAKFPYIRDISSDENRKALGLRNQKKQTKKNYRENECKTPLGHPTGVSHSFSIKNIFMINGLKALLFSCGNI